MMGKSDGLRRPTASSSGGALLAIGNLSFLSGVLLTNGPAIALGLVLLVAPFVVYLRLRRCGPKITFSQDAPQAAFEGDSVQVVVSLENKSERTLHHPIFSEIFEPEFDHQKDIEFGERIRPGEQASASYEGRCHAVRGIYGYGPSVYRLSDFFGWFELEARLSSDRKLTIYPRLDDAGLESWIEGRAARDVGDVYREGPGESSDFWSVREYRRGDARRRIHWRASARRGEFVVREFSKPASGDIAILMDVNQAFSGSGRRHGAFENAIRIAAGTIDRSLHRRRQVHLESEWGRLSPSENGKQDLHAYLDYLVSIEASSDRTFADTLKERDQSIAECGSIVVFLHPYCDEDEALHAILANMARRGSRVVAVLIDDPERGQHQVGPRRLAASGVEIFRVGIEGRELQKSEAVA